MTLTSIDLIMRDSILDTAVMEGIELPGPSTIAKENSTIQMSETFSNIYSPSSEQSALKRKKAPLDFLSKRTKSNNDMENDRAELNKIEIYVRKLQAMKLERELGIEPSIFTKDLTKEYQIEEVNKEEELALDGDALIETDTPNSLGFEEGDIIEMNQQQTSGPEQVASGYITINVEKGLDLNYPVVAYRMKRQAPLIKLMNHYCEKSKLDITTIRFRLCGIHVLGTDTPESLKMIEGDRLEVFEIIIKIATIKKELSLNLAALFETDIPNSLEFEKGDIVEIVKGDIKVNQQQTCGSDYITINIGSSEQNYPLVSYIMKRQAPLIKLMKAYCEKSKLDINTFMFRLRGMIVSGTETPESLKMNGNVEVIEMTALKCE